MLGCIGGYVEGVWGGIWEVFVWYFGRFPEVGIKGQRTENNVFMISS